MQITYQKNDGCIIHKLRKTMLPYKIGETTSMGWKVLNIEYEYKDKFYPEYKYHMLIHNEKLKCLKRQHTEELCMREFKTIMYYFIAVLVVNCLKFILGI